MVAISTWRSMMDRSVFGISHFVVRSRCKEALKNRSHSDTFRGLEAQVGIEATELC